MSRSVTPTVFGPAEVVGLPGVAERHDHREVAGGALRLPVVVDLDPGFGGLVDGHEVGDPAVVAGGAAQGVLGDPTHVDRDAVGRDRGHLELGEVDVLPVVLDPVASPELAQDLDHLVGPGAALAEGAAGEVELLLAPAHAHAQGDAGRRRAPTRCPPSWPPSSGLRIGKMKTLVKNCSRSVWAASEAMATIGSSHGVNASHRRAPVSV